MWAAHRRAVNHRDIHTAAYLARVETATMEAVLPHPQGSLLFMSTPNESIQLTLNGEPYAMATGLTAADLVEQLGLGGRRIAVEINEQIVPKSQLAATPLAAGDQIEVVHAIGGG
jgi:sulfur carrier protein